MAGGNDWVSIMLLGIIGQLVNHQGGRSPRERSEQPNNSVVIIIIFEKVKNNYSSNINNATSSSS